LIRLRRRRRTEANLEFLHAKPSFKEFLSLLSSNCDVAGNLFILTDAKLFDGDAG
jgi:hypothetical protein